MSARCKSVSPLSGLRCVRKTGHKGKHESDPEKLKAFINSLLAEFIPEAKKKKGA